MAHALNHVMKSRDILYSHNSAIKEYKYTHNGTEPDIEYKDQGFTRPKVLILCPFASYGEKCIRSIVKLLPKNIQVLNKKRFFDEYGPPVKDKDEHKAPWEDIFKGNNEDCFRFGLSYSKKAIRLYTSFYNSDIIIASPLGLRLCTGLEGGRNVY